MIPGLTRPPTRRTNGSPLPEIIGFVNPILRGWYEYFKHACGETFRRVDEWVRVRLRSILRERAKGKGTGRGLSSIRRPNASFAGLGLFTLRTARETERGPR